MWYEDLTIHDFGGRTIHRTAVGWLHHKKPFTKGETPKDVYEKLCQLNKKPWLDYLCMGFHECEFCDEAAIKNLNPETQGSLNLTIPYNGKLYHYPEMITHYIKRHSYLPPQEFCEAVLDCPPMDSMQYYNKMVENGGKTLVKYFEESWTDVKKLEK